jgi:hypothetical protein
VDTYSVFTVLVSVERSEFQNEKNNRKIPFVHIWDNHLPNSPALGVPGRKIV